MLSFYILSFYFSTIQLHHFQDNSMCFMLTGASLNVYRVAEVGL